MTQQLNDEFFFKLLDPDHNQDLKFSEGLSDEQITEVMQRVDHYMRAAFEFYMSKGLPRYRVMRDIAKKELMEYLSNPKDKNTDYLNPHGETTGTEHRADLEE